MAVAPADSGVQPGLSMVAFGLLAGLAGLWVYSATRDSAPSSSQRGDRSRNRGGRINRSSLRRTQSIRRPRRQVSTTAIAEESRDEHPEAGSGTEAATHATDRSTAGAGGDSDGSSSDDGDSSTEEDGTEVDMRILHLLCTIAEDQSRRNGIIHPGTTCNGCQETPIRGTRYKCSQCANVDLCEACEAHDVHRHHVMLRISVPLPPLMNPRIPLMRKLYPGTLMPKELPRGVRKKLEDSTYLDRIDIINLYNEFCVLATVDAEGTEVITRDAFYKCLGQFGRDDSVIASRLFAFYDANGDGVIDFPELARGFSVYNKGTLEEKVPGVFRAYDVDGDGKVSRDDLRVMLEAFADASREITKNMVRTLEDDVLEEPSKLLPGQPISAAFTAPIPTDSPSGLDKEVSALQAEVQALRATTAARRVSMLPPRAEDGVEPETAPGDIGRAGSEADGSVASVAATTSATIGTTASLRLPRRMSARALGDSTAGLGPDADSHADRTSIADLTGLADLGGLADVNGLPDFEAPPSSGPQEPGGNEAAAAAFTGTIPGSPRRTASTAVNLLADDAAARSRGAQPRPSTPLLLPTLWHDRTEDSEWAVMEALGQDAVRLMIDEIFTEAAPSDPICMTYAEFVAYLRRNSSLAIYLEVLGTIF
ncbi:hypothetical protein GGF46_001597 [Coemansia sp. RSA 552]|nr:hypothetical protein GGF46_001597 [Coemansia sp. RSA 552]